MRETIALLTPAPAPDEGGGRRLDYVEGSRLWAEIARLPTTQDFLGDRRRRLRRLAVTIRTRRDIAPGARIRLAGDDYEVASIEDADDRGRRLTLICEEIAQ